MWSLIVSIPDLCPPSYFILLIDQSEEICEKQLFICSRGGQISPLMHVALLYVLSISIVSIFFLDYLLCRFALVEFNFFFDNDILSYNGRKNVEVGTKQNKSVLRDLMVVL